MISAFPAVGYIQEPFNLRNQRPGSMTGGVFKYSFTYVEDDNESVYYEPIRNILNLRCNLLGEVKRMRHPRDSLRLMKHCSRFLWYRIRGSRPLVKDPIAFFSAEWLASRFDMDVVVMIRHPAAVASSLKRRNFVFPFSHFLAQPLLMERHLYPWETEISEFVECEHDVVDQAALLWKLIYHVAIKYRNIHEDWNFVRHEDLSRDPVRGFRELFGRLNVGFTGDVAKVLRGTAVLQIRLRQRRKASDVTVDLTYGIGKAGFQSPRLRE